MSNLLESVFTSCKIGSTDNIVGKDKHGDYIKYCSAKGCRRKFTSVNSTRLFCDRCWEKMCRLSDNEMIAFKRAGKHRAYEIGKKIKEGKLK